MRGAYLILLIVSLAAAMAASADSAPVAATTSIAEPAPYTVPNTQVRAVHSEETGADYQLFIATPPDYKTSGKTYPVVYMLDADYSFALTRNIVQHYVERKQLPEMILVAIAYPGAAESLEVYRENRKRDYTPSLIPAAKASDAGAAEPVAQGGAIRFRNFIANEVVPFMANNFPTSADRTFIGHSYGGLFGTYVLLTEPELFKRYVIVSPSLWYGDRLIFGVEHTTATDRHDIDRTIERHAFFAIGGAETREAMGAPMVEQLKQFYRSLEQRHDPALSLALRVYPEDTHASVFPGAVARGLLAVFPQPKS
ncbi:MAG: alpha/beta hydrolase [Alphaproteobacteria bacterium]|nr:alpha/beta hydrolase [Alphaproteobacteria bacterium]